MISVCMKRINTHRASCNSKADIFTIFVKLHMIVDIERPAVRFAPVLINK